MKSTDAPSKQAVPFGTNGPREAITATTPSGSNQASYDQGFPPITMTLKSAGGLPPKGQDMNQILFEQSSFNRYFAAGGGYVYDSTFSSSIGGYPKGSVIPSSDASGYWLNSSDDNNQNPESSGASLTGWVPFSNAGITNISGLSSASISLSTLDAAKERIVLSGLLTANINIVLPAWVKRWYIINNTTGSFSVVVKTPSGSGVTLPSGSRTVVFGDGTNITSFSNTLSLQRSNPFGDIKSDGASAVSTAINNLGLGTAALASLIGNGNSVPSSGSFSLGVAGAFRLPTGDIVQWDQGTTVNGGMTKNFPTPFPTACTALVPVYYATLGSPFSASANSSNRLQANINLVNPQGTAVNGVTVGYIAIGY